MNPNPAYTEIIPLHLCSIGAFITAAAVFFDNEKLRRFAAVHRYSGSAYCAGVSGDGFGDFSQSFLQGMLLLLFTQYAAVYGDFAASEIQKTVIWGYEIQQHYACGNCSPCVFCKSEVRY